MRVATALCALIIAPLFYAHSVAANPPIIDYKVIDQQAHPKQLFTQGLIVDGPWLYESSGLYGKSLLARYKASDTSRVATQALPKSLFAEGLTLFNDQFYLLTWRSQRLLVFDRNWTQVAEYSYRGQGWGLTHNGTQLIASDGSDRLKFYDPEGYKLVKTLHVTGHDRTWDRLNELEYVDGIIWANRWLSDEVVAIDAQSGQVLGVMHLGALSKPWRNAHEKVLNGLAWSPDHQAMWVTGKLWPVRYLIKIDLAGVLADKPR